MAKSNCTYCECESSPRNLLRICTLPGVKTVVNVCDICFTTEYPADKAAKQAVHMAEAILAEANGDDEFFKPLGKSLGWRAALGML